MTPSQDSNRGTQQRVADEMQETARRDFKCQRHPSLPVSTIGYRTAGWHGPIACLATCATKLIGSW